MRRLLPRQVGRRFVENQEFRAAQRSARRGHELLLPDGQVAKHLAGRQMEAHVVEQALRRAGHLALLQQAEADFLVAEKDVRCNRQVPAEHDFLVYRIDAAVDRFLRSIEADGLAVPEDFAGRAPDHAGQQLDQRRFAGAVFADDGVDFIVVERQRGGLQRQHRAVVLCEAAQFEDRAALAGAGLIGRVARRDVDVAHPRLLPRGHADTDAAPCQIDRGRLP